MRLNFQFQQSEALCYKYATMNQIRMWGLAMDLTLFLAFLGLVSVVRTSARVLRWLHLYFLRPSKALHRYGSWALVTGATDGIGKAFAFQLARHGLNLILVSRRADKLESVAKEIMDNHHQVEIKTVALDFTEDDMTTEGVRRIEEAIEGVDVGVLVNNAGAAYRRAVFFDEVEERRWRDVARVNVEGTSWVSRVVMKGMVERGRGAVVNIGSGASCVLPSFPLSSVYSATKAYVDQFSRCLYVEYKNKGIDVQCQVPLYVATKMVSIRRSSFFVPSSDTYARAALRWIGYEPRCTPYWPHSILWCLISMLPESAVDKWRLGVCLNLRKKSQLKDAKKKEQ